MDSSAFSSLDQFDSAAHVKSQPRCGDSLREFSEENARVLNLVQTVRDRSIGSEELLVGAIDAYTRHHLSPKRVNAFRPLERLLCGNVLQIGAGAGAVTRFISERGCHVTAFERDPQLAAIAAARCEDCVGTEIQSTSDLSAAVGPYDFVVTAGDVLHKYFPQVSLPSVLDDLKRRLAPSGVLVAAFQNGLALESIAAALSGEGIVEPPDISLGRQEIERMLLQSGFKRVQFLYPFPNHHEARLVVTPATLDHPPPRLEAILAAYATPSESRIESNREAIWRLVVENGLLPFVCTSFLAIAFARSPSESIERDLFYLYSTDRRRHFSRQTRMRIDGDRFTFSRERIFPEAPPPADAQYRQRAYEEPYLVGEPYLRDFKRSWACGAWGAADIARWAEPWLELLSSNARDESNPSFIGTPAKVRVLPSTFVDCIPDNIRVSIAGALQPFDFEFEAIAPIPLKFVVFRGFFYSLINAGPAPAPFPGHATLVDLVVEIMRLGGFQMSASELEHYVWLEADLQHAVTGLDQEEVRRNLLNARIRVLADAQPAPEAQPFTFQLFWKSVDQ